MEEKKYVTIQFEIAPELYRLAEESLSAIGASVSQFYGLCLLEGARYIRDIPQFTDLPT